MPSNTHHQFLLNQIKGIVVGYPFTAIQGSSYFGNKDFAYPISNPQLRQIVKDWYRGNPDLSLGEIMDVLNSLYKGKSSTEKYLGGYIIEYLPMGFRSQINPDNVDKWLGNLTGWDQVDSLCQSKFRALDMLPNWTKWENLLITLSKSPNINKRRASLVLLTCPVRESPEKVFVDVAFSNLDVLKGERDILITKAVSWLLREMIKLHKASVQEYLSLNYSSLPSVAVREVSNKLKTGRK
ncbi:MAG TPA: DNA alkylation repair protein [bacterium]|nr:DNA alkylation repair protein [bacterium]